jgi:hypothetical protein
VPVLWLVGLLGFIAFWCTCAGTRPGYAVSESLRLLAQRDPGIIRLAHWVPSNGFETTYDVIVGGAVAALATPRQPRPDS